MVIDPQGPVRAGRTGALGVVNSKGDSRPGAGCVRMGGGSHDSSCSVSIVF